MRRRALDFVFILPHIYARHTRKASRKRRQFSSRFLAVVKGEARDRFVVTGVFLDDGTRVDIPETGVAVRRTAHQEVRVGGKRDVPNPPGKEGNGIHTIETRGMFSLVL